VVVLGWPFKGAEALLDKLHAARPFASAMVIAEDLAEAPADLFAHVVLLKGACSQAAINDAAKTLSARKRGPRKQALSEPGAAIAMVA
jgi:hypothetical protein